MEDIIKTCMEIAQESSEKTQSVAKTVMSCKTLNEFTDVQTRLAQASFDDFMSNATRISEKAVKLCTEVFEPINDQMGKTIKRATDNIAA
jgi:phasin family protein